MTVQVRSMKMTRSLFNQMTMIVIDELNHDRLSALGWVFIGEKFIVIQDPINSTLYKMRPVTIVGKSQDGCTVHVRTSNNIVGHWKFQNFLRASEWINTVQRLMAESFEKGQIFL